MLRSKLGLPPEGDINSSGLLKANAEINPSGPAIQFASFFRTAAPAAAGPSVGEENDGFLTGGMVNNNKFGWMLDKERMLTQLRTAERLLCKKMPPENLQVKLRSFMVLPFSLFVISCRNLLIHVRLI